MRNDRTGRMEQGTDTGWEMRGSLPPLTQAEMEYVVQISAIYVGATVELGADGCVLRFPSDEGPIDFEPVIIRRAGAIGVHLSASVPTDSAVEEAARIHDRICVLVPVVARLFVDTRGREVA